MKKLFALLLALVSVSVVAGQPPRGPTFSINDVTVNEGAGTVTFTVTKSGTINRLPSVLTYATRSVTAGVADYAPTAGTLTFNPTDRTKTITVSIVDDVVHEATETFEMRIRVDTNGRLSRGVGTASIIDNDPVTTTPTPNPPVVDPIPVPNPSSTPTPDPTPTPEPTPVPTPTTSPGWTFCANEGQTCTFSGTYQVRYGAGSSWVTKSATGSISCDNATFGDPIFGTIKTCETGAAVVQPPVVVATTGLTGETPIASNFTISDFYTSGGSNRGSAAPDVVGAFRFLCMPGQVAYIDPIVNPGQRSMHLHQFFGNTLVSENSTYASLRASGDSTCVNKLNRSGYWIPALLNGLGQVVKPDYVTVYYKRRPLTDPLCDPANPYAEGKCVKIPNGLKFIMGRNMLDLSAPSTGGFHFVCDASNIGQTVSGQWANLEDLQANCPAGARFGAILDAPHCWDGVHLDSADHRSHVGYGSYGDWGYYKCPDNLPYAIPVFTMGVFYTTAAGETYSFSSDAMNPGGKRGETYHGDYFMAWDPTVHDIWENGCINKLLNCSAGELDHGLQMTQVWPFLWNANPRLVPVP